jgi:hypothetical protein
MPWYQGGRASEAWGITTRVAPYALIWNPPARTSTELAEVSTGAAAESAAESAADTETADDHGADTSITVDAGFSIGRWLGRFYVFASIRRRRKASVAMLVQPDLPTDCRD